MLRAGATYGQRSAARLNEATDPAQRLCERGIIWVDAERHKIGMWHEVLAAAGGRIFTRWPIELEPEPEPVVEPAQPGSLTLNAIESIVQHVAIEPLAGLKTGSIGVEPIRDLAKRVGRDVAAVGCLMRVAVGGPG